VSKISLVEEKGAQAMETTALKGRQGIQQELDMLKMDWENYTTQVRSLHDNLDRAIEHWIGQICFVEYVCHQICQHTYQHDPSSRSSNQWLPAGNHGTVDDQTHCVHIAEL
jgi:hypothetical protein